MVHKLELFISVWPLLNVWPWLSHLVFSRTSLGWSVRISEVNRERFKNHGISGLKQFYSFSFRWFWGFLFWENEAIIASQLHSLYPDSFSTHTFSSFHLENKDNFWGVKLPTYNLDFLFCCGLKTLASLIILLSCIFLISVLPTQSTERSTKLKNTKSNKNPFH